MPFKAGAIYGEAILNTKKWTTGLTAMQKSTALGMAAITSAFTAAMIKTGKANNEFSKALTNVSTLIDTNAVSMDDLSKQLIKLNPELGDTTELTKGLYQSFSSGAKTAEEAMDLTTTGAKFAKAALTDTFTAVDVLSTAMNAYGKEVVSAEHASDLFFTTIKLGKITGEELASSIGTSIPLFSSAGISLEELSAGMAAMTKQGVNANKATIQLNAIVNSFLKPSEKMKENLHAIGYESGSAFLKAKGLSGALELVAKSTAGDGAKIAELIPNIRAMRGVMALTGTGAEEFNNILEDMSDVVGANQEAFEKQDKTWETAKNALDKVSIAVGEVSKQFIDKLLVGVTKASTWFINLSDESKHFASTFIVVGAAVGAVTLAVVGLNAALVALAANPVTAVIMGIGLLTTGVITLAKTLEDKRITKAEERFHDIAIEIGVAADKTKDLGKAMLELEDMLQTNSMYEQFATAEQSAEGLKRQIEHVSEKYGIAKEKIAEMLLTSDKVNETKKETIRNIQKQYAEEEKLNKQLKIAKELNSTTEIIQEKMLMHTQERKNSTEEYNQSLQDQIDLEEQREADRKERELAEIARVEGVKKARLKAEENYRLELSKTQAKIDYGMITLEEGIKENISSAETLANAMIDIGYDTSTAGQIGNKVLEKALKIMEEEKEKLKEIQDEERKKAADKVIIYQATEERIAELLQKRENERLRLLQITTEAEKKASEEITEKEREEAEKRKQIFWDYYGTIINATSYFLDQLSGIKNMALQNDLDQITLTYQSELEALNKKLDDGLISQEEHDKQLAILNKNKKDKENELNKKAFEANKSFEIGKIWMSVADAIAGWWSAATSLGPIAGPIFGTAMSAASIAMGVKQTELVNEQQFVPAMEKGGTASGVTRVNESGGEILNLPDGTVVIPHDISRQIAQDSGMNNIINVSFEGAYINNEMDLDTVVSEVSRKLGMELRAVV